MDHQKSKLPTLFASVFIISAVTFGGGFVIVSFFKKKFVDELHWIDEKEMMDYIAIAQTSPGSIAVNAAILMGGKMAGLPGIAVAVLGTVLPPMIILALISAFYSLFATNHVVALILKGMQAGVAAIILDVVLNLGSKVVKERNLFRMILMAAAFCLVFFLKVNVILVILGALVVGVASSFLEKKIHGPSDHSYSTEKGTDGRDEETRKGGRK